jgi:hypothetical protein
MYININKTKEGKHHIGHTSVDERTILKWVIKK